MKINRIPSYIQEYQAFGWGNFSDEEIKDKCEMIKRKMETKNLNQSPLVSVVIPAYNEKRYLIATLRSLVEQTFDDFEVIVVSNGEEEGNETQKIAKQCGAHVIYEAEGRVSLARQRGLDEARGKYIITTDADTLHPPEWIETIAKEMEERQITYGYGEVVSLSEKLIPQLFVKACNWVGRLRRHVKALRFSGVAEANSYFLREEANKVGGYNTNLDYSEGFSLIQKMCPDLNPTLIESKGARVYTSGRSIDEMNLRQLCKASIEVGLSRMKGNEKRLGKEDYPDYR